MAAAETCVMPRDEVNGALTAASTVKQHKSDGVSPPSCKPTTHGGKPSSGAHKKGKSVNGEQPLSTAEAPKKRRGGRGANSRRKEKVASTVNERCENSEELQPTAETQSEVSRSNFDCSAAILQVREGVFVSAVSGTRMGASLEAALLEKGVTAVLSTLEKAGKQTETFEQHQIEATVDGDRLRPLHDACDLIDEAVSEGGAVFVHSKAGFARSDWAVFVVLGYMVKYQSVKLSGAIDSLAESAKHAISPPGAFRRDLVRFEEEVLGETSVSDDWVLADENANGSKNHSLSRRKLAENLNDRRLLKKKSPHK